MKIALVGIMWNVIATAPLKQNKINVLDGLKAYTFCGCSCLVFPCLPGHNEAAPTCVP
jgi:hypothetical protein